MTRYVLRRIATMVPILLAISIAVFWAANRIARPGGDLAINPRVSPADRADYFESLGLNDPFFVRYLSWLGDFVRGDLGTSLVRNGSDVWPFVRTALANTLVLVSLAVVLSLAAGITIGAISAIRRGSFTDYVATTVSFLGISIPVFWLGLMLQLFFGLYLANWLGITPPLLPTAGLYSPGQQGFDLVDRLRHLVLPAMTLSLQLVAVYSRYMRASLLDVMSSDHIRAARGRGLRERTVVVRHGVRNALIPVTTQAAVDMGQLVGGLIVTEQVFQYPGMGRLFVNAMVGGDYPMLLATTMIVAAAVMLLNLAADLFYGVLDPRIRRGSR
ncbi:MAG: ABC transporter permease [Acidimicrobiales bacterium]|nr:ABC transporter permease [Acidimicrobiaceae bacterium]MXV87550.1 ABC transporter permease [Acidimicrobiales bacterium]MCY3609526.1 ABC transporter permease [Acidimicrobiaceae bacterium]MXZ16272.1 ABC transporter permease [Acidimicrobiales bacterium]MYA81165.1 ABC transporter permease [Acidimicrobiales bacterium]